MSNEKWKTRDPANMTVTYRLGRQLCHFGYIFLLRGRVFGLKNVPVHEGVLLASNHQSFLDPMLVTLALPRECHYMARDSLFQKPAFRKLIEAYNAFPVKRGSSDVGAIKASLSRLKHNALITAFPEATRTSDGKVNPCQAGVILLASKANVPLVPTAIEGAFDAWPRHRKFPRRATVYVSYGEPVIPDVLKSMNRTEAADMVTARIRSLHNQLRRIAGKEPFDYDE